MVKFPDTAGYLTKDSSQNYFLNSLLSSLPEVRHPAGILEQNQPQNPPWLNSQIQLGISPDASPVFSAARDFFLYFQYVMSQASDGIRIAILWM